MGKRQGERKDNKPAIKAIVKVISGIISTPLYTYTWICISYNTQAFLSSPRDAKK